MTSFFGCKLSLAVTPKLSLAVIPKLSLAVIPKLLLAVIPKLLPAVIPKLSQTVIPKLPIADKVLLTRHQSSEMFALLHVVLIVAHILFVV